MPEASVMTTEQRRSRRNARIVIALTAIAVAGAIVLNLPMFYFLRDDYRALAAFLQNMDSGRYGDAFAGIAPEMQARGDYPRMVAQQDALKERVGRLRGFHITHLDSHGNRSRRITHIQATLHFERAALNFDFTLLEDHGHWYVWSFEQR